MATLSTCTEEKSLERLVDNGEGEEEDVVDAGDF
jgi:hypothetical protein